MKQDLVLPIIALVAGALLARECFPRREEVPIPVPTIVTVQDTIHDTVRIAPPRLPPTPNIVIRVTLHTPSQIPVNVVAAERPNLWPILNLTVGASRGDTSRTTTFSLRSGQIATSSVWTPGPLEGAWADSTMTPKLSFGEPLKPRGASLWEKSKLVLGGIGTGIVLWEIIR